MIESDLTVGELKRYLSAYQDDDPVVFQHIILPTGEHYRLHLHRIDNRGVGEDGVCHFEWGSLKEEDRFI